MPLNRPQSTKYGLPGIPPGPATKAIASGIFD
jgi:hypothetical protein